MNVQKDTWFLLLGGFSPTHLKKNITVVKLEIFPNFRDEHKKYVKPPPSLDQGPPT